MESYGKCGLLRMAFFFFFLLSVIFLRLIHVVARIDTLFLFIAEQCAVVWMYHRSPVYQHLDCLYFLLNKSNAAMNIHITSLSGHIFSFLLSKNLGIEWPGLMVNVCLTL